MSVFNGSKNKLPKIQRDPGACICGTCDDPDYIPLYKWFVSQNADETYVSLSLVA
jgi:hypothetical protein